MSNWEKVLQDKELLAKVEDYVRGLSIDSPQEVFDEAYGEDRMQEGVLLIAYSEENENFEVTLRVGGKKYAFEKTEVWISKIPEALETDGKAQRKRVFKNFEGDNRNEFRVK